MRLISYWNHDTPFRLISYWKRLQIDVDHWISKYNEQRPHSGKYCYGKTPMQTFREAEHLALEKTISSAELSDMHGNETVAV